MLSVVFCFSIYYWYRYLAYCYSLLIHLIILWFCSFVHVDNSSFSGPFFPSRLIPSILTWFLHFHLLHCSITLFISKIYFVVTSISFLLHQLLYVIYCFFKVLLDQLIFVSFFHFFHFSPFSKYICFSYIYTLYALFLLFIRFHYPFNFIFSLSLFLYFHPSLSLLFSLFFFWLFVSSFPHFLFTIFYLAHVSLVLLFYFMFNSLNYCLIFLLFMFLYFLISMFVYWLFQLSL